MHWCWLRRGFLIGCGLLLTPQSLQKWMWRSVRYRTCWRMLRQVGLGKTKKLNNANSTSSTVCIVRRDSCGNFGTIPCTQVVGSYEKESHTWQPLQLEHHLPAASKVVYANSSILCDRTLSTAQQLVHFEVMVTPVDAEIEQNIEKRKANLQCQVYHALRNHWLEVTTFRLRRNAFETAS